MTKKKATQKKKANTKNQKAKEQVNEKTTQEITVQDTKKKQSKNNKKSEKKGDNATEIVKNTIKKPEEAEKTTPVQADSETSFATNTFTTDKVTEPSQIKKLDIKKFIPALIAIIPIVIFASLNFYFIPEVLLTQTDDFKSQQEKEKQEKLKVEKEKKLKERLAKEDKILNFEQNQTWKLSMEIEKFGTLEIESKNEFSPEIVKNFIRLIYRNSFNDTTFDRIVKQENFNIIQGGTIGKSQQGQSAYFINDENPGFVKGDIWKVKPEFKVENEENVLSNQPELYKPDLYGDFNPDTGTIKYPKGSIVAYSDLGPTSIASQFFIALTDTEAPAEFPVFAKVSQSSFTVLDKIMQEIESQKNEQGVDNNIPNKEIRIKEIKITSPSL
jgi:cyclophilin family peptidyl-prolyl cis-trans isomerase